MINPKARRKNNPASAKFNFSDLPRGDQIRWWEASEMYQLDFLSSSKFLGEVERMVLATQAAKKYGLGGNESGDPTAQQVEAVPSFL